MSLSPLALSTLARLELFGIKLGLESMRALLAALGNPERRVPAVLVAGTNGKGSTSTLLAAIAGHAGHRVGLYTSPHLESPRERVRIDGRALDGAELSELVLEIVATAEAALGAPPTYFEALTAVAFTAFARRAVEIAVLEIGMGGRLDATNAAEPLLSVITPIGFDHQQYLGDTLTAIAREKAGVLRAGRPAVAWVPAPEAKGTLVDVAGELGAELELVDETCAARRLSGRNPEESAMRVQTPAGVHVLHARLQGAHQLGNIALAVRAAERLHALGWHRVDGRAIAAGVAAARWPGRLERVPVGDGRIVLLDGAHNADGAAALAAFLDESVADYDLLFGALADKDHPSMLPALARRARRVTLTAPPSPRALPPADLRAALGRGDALAEDDPERALTVALTHLPAGGVLVACGSLYLVGALREALRRRFGVPLAAADTPLW